MIVGVAAVAAAQAGKGAGKAAEVAGGGAAVSTRPASGPAATAAAGAVEQQEDTAPLHETMSKMLRVGTGIMMYCNAHGGKYPADLGQTTRYGLTDQQDGKPFRLTPVMKAAQYISARDLAAPEVPADVTPDWVTKHSSFVYLGTPDVTMGKLRKIPGDVWGTTVILHEKFDAAGDGGVLAVGMLDGHIEAMKLDDAKRAIEASKKVLADVGKAAGK